MVSDLPRVATDHVSERERWEAELRLREREVTVKEREISGKAREHELKSRELEAKLAEQKWSRWANPLLLAVLAAALAAIGNLVVTQMSGTAQRKLERVRSIAQLELERHKADAQIGLERSKAQAQQTIEETKAEAQRILEVIRTADPEKVAENLDFLLKAGLIADPKRRSDLEHFLKNRAPGRGPSITPFVQMRVPPPPPPVLSCYVPSESGADALAIAQAVSDAWKDLPNVESSVISQGPNDIAIDIKLKPIDYGRDPIINQSIRAKITKRKSNAIMVSVSSGTSIFSLTNNVYSSIEDSSDKMISILVMNLRDAIYREIERFGSPISCTVESGWQWPATP